MKEYKIITLGASGSGKTVFLASMFKALAIQADHGFYLDVKDFEQRKLLNAIYTEIITKETWPKGTRYSEISEWTYICRVKNPDNLEHYDAFKFVYYDYAGGRLTDLNEEDAELEDIIKESDAILGLIDGKKIYDALMSETNQLNNDSSLNKDLKSIIKWMSICHSPIHFVISKWDLLEEKFSLKQIREHLLEIPDFKNLVYERNQINSPARLIPVSSVGSNFATLESDGSMKKTPGAIPKPFQVEAPISCVFPDHIERQLSELLDKRQQIESQKIEKKNKWLELSSFVFDCGLEIILDLVFEDKSFQKILLNKSDDFLFNHLRKKHQESVEKLQEEQEISLKKVKDEKTALEPAINSFFKIKKKLELDFPESELILD